MPATEQTWRDTKAMHLVFGVSSIVMFLATIWLLAADHYREWKDYQRKFQQIENRTLASRYLEEQTVDFVVEENRLKLAVDAAIVEPPSQDAIDRFIAALPEPQAADAGVRDAYQRLVAEVEQGSPADDGSDPLPVFELARRVEPPRRVLLDQMQAAVTQVRYEEDRLARQRKFRRADLDAQRSKYDLGVRDQIGAALAPIKKKLAAIEADVQRLTLEYQQASQQRKAMEEILAEVTRDEDVARKNLLDHQAGQRQLQTTLQERTAFGRGSLEMPIVDAFGRPLQIDQIWLPNLTLNNNFKEVARFDRCVTCHQAIQNTAPGSAVEPGYPIEQSGIAITLTAPKTPPESRKDSDGNEIGRTTQTIYGFGLAREGILASTDVTVDFVWPGSTAAQEGLQRADVITHIQVGNRQEKIVNRAMALRYLVDQAPWGQPVQLTVRRGVPHPFATHPRLDLFVGSMSPHKMSDMGCTICHDGQGSATDFKWANHTPNSPAEAKRWARQYGWFDNHHWIYPMLPERFIESNCLKCHHQVTELEPSERFRDPPAPKLVAGYKLVQRYGCYGCHEINGYESQDRTIGPDVRNEPPYAAVAQQLDYLIQQSLDAPPADGGLSAELRTTSELSDELSWHMDRTIVRHELLRIVSTDAGRATAVDKLAADPGLRGEGRELVGEVRQSPEDLELREKLVAWIEQDASKPSSELSTSSHNLAQLISRPPFLPAPAHALSDLLKDVASPGRMRRTGPSLRYVASKLGSDTLFRWISNPQSIRPSSKMPHFFGQYNHLSAEERAVSEKFEPIEARAITAYLEARSQPYAYAPADPRVTEPPDATRGKQQFEMRGCLACHQHQGTPGDSDHGPNLTDLGKKLRTQDGKQWLRSWLLQPDRYHRRTVMPNTFLEPLPLLGEDGKPVPLDGSAAESSAAEGSDEPAYRMTDPAADITTYLLGTNWQAEPDQLPALSEGDMETIAELARMYLTTAFPTARAEEYLKNGIPQHLAGGLKGAEAELVGPMSQDKLLTYVGRRTISKYGCFGCHDIPDFEGAKPIGTTLADWGRKETSKLAFEHIVHYVERKHATGHAGGRGKHDANHANHEDDEHDAGGGHHPPSPEELGPDEGYFYGSLLHHQRAGFLRQKLLEPRSYDYEKAGNKAYNDRLRMPQFPWPEDPQQRNDEIEQIMTFVLGLVAEPPADPYVYHPDVRREAIVQGEKVLQTFNCAGCHILDLDRWEIAFQPGEIEAPPKTTVFPFLEPHFTPEQIKASTVTDRRGRVHGSLTGMLRTNEDGYPEIMAWVEEDKAFDSVEQFRKDFKREPDVLGYGVELWDPAVLDGDVFLVKDPLPTIPERMIAAGKHYPAHGGDFARLLLPIAVQFARKTEPTATGEKAWAWVPPPLVGQGKKTKEPWLRDFLLNPRPIRPGVLLRMPKFNMSPLDADHLVRYFAARDHKDYPNYKPQARGSAELELAAEQYQERLAELGLSGSRFDDAMKIVISKAGCIACHGVADQKPEGTASASGPNLADVYRRLQWDYMHRWIAKPSFTLPYTQMQELIPYKPDSPTLGGFSIPILKPDGEPELDADGQPKTVQPYHGNSFQQLDAVVDLLSNFDRYLESQTSIRAKVASENQGAAGATPSGGAQ